MRRNYRVLVINPGSTSTKVAVFDGDDKIFQKNISHDGDQLNQFKEIQDQLSHRVDIIEAALREGGIDFSEIDLYSGRGGGQMPLEGGVYEVNDRLLADAARRTRGSAGHPAMLGSQICAAYAKKYGKKAYVANSPDTDEFQDLARITGFKDLHRKSHVHALNHKEISLRYCKREGLVYDQVNLIVCHIGGGISVVAHRRGKMVDSNDIIGGDGPMTPSRSGSLPVMDLIKLMTDNGLSTKEITDRVNKTSGLLEHLGTNSTIEVERRIEQGDRYAKLVYDAMLYQIAKCAGASAAVLMGEVKAILLTGGISNSKYVVETLTSYLQWIAPVAAMPGEFEMEALASAAIRVARGEERTKAYTGEPVWSGFHF
ncbi:MAG: butyrate kinase [Synergistaceae bacterium]|jgi:butyrate kinase|nr:butyrate kinase [Synergistaceae bacterium]